jgi:oligosaccharide reducing-end xylanase
MPGLRAIRPWLLAGWAIQLSTACTSTVDSLGRDFEQVEPPDAMAPPDAMGPPDAKPPPEVLTPLTGPDAYPNLFHEHLGLPFAEIDERVEAAYERLFHGDPASEAFYFTTPEGDAYIEDIYHGDVRTEGLGLGMLISVELDKQEEFDKLWSYAKRVLRVENGGNAGYFRSVCDTLPSGTALCLDPYGLQQFVMSLIFAHDRWQSNGAIDYERDVFDIIDVMLHKQEQNDGNTEESATNTFDTESKLVFDVPKREAASRTRPSILMPAYYELWAAATGNAYFTEVAEAARDYFPTVANQVTGLMPLRAYFDGTAMPGAEHFTPEAYRVFLNLALDQIWTPGDPFGSTACGRVLSFFAEQGLDKYVGKYELDGTPVTMERDPTLALVNGVTAAGVPMAFPIETRRAFIRGVWDMPMPEPEHRYYQGILQLFALLVLSGKMQVL